MVINTLIILALLSSGVISTKSADYYKGYSSSLICEQEVIAQRVIIYPGKKLPIPKPKEPTGEMPIKAPTGPVEAVEPVTETVPPADKVAQPGKPEINPEELAPPPKQEDDEDCKKNGTCGQQYYPQRPVLFPNLRRLLGN